MNSFDNYISGILKQISDYFQILINLQDKANDIEVIKKASEDLSQSVQKIGQAMYNEAKKEEGEKKEEEKKDEK